jgi:hypothetical protein
VGGSPSILLAVNVIDLCIDGIRSLLAEGVIRLPKSIGFIVGEPPIIDGVSIVSTVGPDNDYGSVKSSFTAIGT